MACRIQSMTIRLDMLDIDCALGHAGRMSSSPHLPPRSDPLSEILHSVHFTGALYCVSHLGAPWGIGIPRLENLMTLQIVTAGQYWIDVDDGEPFMVGPGSMTLLPHGLPHHMRSEPDVGALPLFDLPVQRISDRFETVRHGGDGPQCRVTYGVLRFDPIAARRLTAVLPTVIHLDAWQADATGWLQSTLRLIAAEASQLGPGAEIIITRLADVLVIQAIRTWIEQASIPEQGWIAAFDDEQIGRALALIHQTPAAPWSVGGLAREIGMSRSAFSARFTTLVGMSVMSYVGDWRLQLARNRLQSSAATVASVAHQVGYQSEATFGRAYKRAFGVSPGGDRTPVPVDELLPPLRTA